MEEVELTHILLIAVVTLGSVIAVACCCGQTKAQKEAAEQEAKLKDRQERAENQKQRYDDVVKEKQKMLASMTSQAIIPPVGYAPSQQMPGYHPSQQMFGGTVSHIGGYPPPPVVPSSIYPPAAGAVPYIPSSQAYYPPNRQYIPGQLPTTTVQQQAPNTKPKLQPQAPREFPGGGAIPAEDDEYGVEDYGAYEEINPRGGEKPSDSKTAAAAAATPAAEAVVAAPKAEVIREAETEKTETPTRKSGGLFSVRTGKNVEPASGEAEQPLVTEEETTKRRPKGLFSVRTGREKEAQPPKIEAEERKEADPTKPGALFTIRSAEPPPKKQGLFSVLTGHPGENEKTAGEAERKKQQGLFSVLTAKKVEPLGDDEGATSKSLRKMSLKLPEDGRSRHTTLYETDFQADGKRRISKV